MPGKPDCRPEAKGQDGLVLPRPSSASPGNVPAQGRAAWVDSLNDAGSAVLSQTLDNGEETPLPLPPSSLAAALEF